MVCVGVAVDAPVPKPHHDSLPQFISFSTVSCNPILYPCSLIASREYSEQDTLSGHGVVNLDRNVWYNHTMPSRILVTTRRTPEPLWGHLPHGEYPLTWG